MPTDDHPTTGIATDAENEHRNRRTQPKPRPSDHAPTSAQPQKRSWFAIPTPIRYLFDHTPLITYARSSLPIRSPSDDDRHQNTLYVFTTPADAACGAPSYNPGCLKWQTLLKIYKVPFRTQLSNNHASPTGALPFLIPSTSTLSTTTSTTAPTRPHKNENPPSSPQPITTQTFPTYLRAHAPTTTRKPSPPSQLHLSLLSPLRLAYLHVLYLHPPTYTTTTSSLYITPAISNRLARDIQAHALRTAAWEEVTRGCGDDVAAAGLSDEGRWKKLLEEAEEALEGLAGLLGEKRWFGRFENAENGRGDGGGGEDENDSRLDGDDETVPGILDASVFAYTHIILDICAREPGESPAKRLADVLEGHANVVAHRRRVLDLFYS